MISIIGKYHQDENSEVNHGNRKNIHDGAFASVRLPKKYRFSSSEVKIRREGDEVILSPISTEEALEAFLALPKCPDFELDRKAAQQLQERDLF